MMMKIIRWLAGLFVVLFTLLFLLLVGISVAVIQREPLVVSSGSSQLDGAESVNELIAQLQSAFSKRDESHVINLSEDQIESLVGVLQRAVSHFSGQVNVTEYGGMITFTFSPTSMNVYINVSVLVLPSDTLLIDYIQVGNLSLPGRWVLAVAEKGINYWTDSKVATLALTRVKKVDMRAGEVSMYIAPLEEFLAELDTIKDSMDTDDELETLSAYYLRYIAGRDITLSKYPVPLIEYLREGMARAREQSNTGEEAALHNKAVIFALAALVGHHRVGRLVGDIQPHPNKALKPKAPSILLERNDLARHFIISAALELLSEDGMSLAIGEFKELMDRGAGGSGFSFVDLGADMAGAEFARVASHPHYAQQTQNDIARIHDDFDIVPDIITLPEGLSKQEFTRRYSQVDSESYLEEVNNIKRLLSQVPLYSLLSGQ